MTEQQRDEPDEPSVLDCALELPGRLVGRVAGLVGSILDLASLPRLKLGTDELNVQTHRDDGADAAIVLVHGFGVCERTWGDLPALVTADPCFAGWDVFSIGYDTGIAPDVRGLWSADPDIATLATYLRSRLRLAPLAQARAVALVAHSMGGLIVQRALVDDPELVKRTSHVVLYGTPSGGLGKARLGSFLKLQIRDMATGSEFLTDLRARWDEMFGATRPFELWTVAGDRDVFVPARSSLEPFPRSTHVVIPGNHLEICYAHDTEDLCVRVLVDAVTGERTPGGPFNAARVAVERREFHRAVELLLPHADELDDGHLIELALALDEIGRRDEGIEVLRAHANTSDVMGTLAGRLKRVWMAEGRRREADEACELYERGYESAATSGDDAEAAYQAVNLAFLELAYRHDLPAAERWAERALACTDRAPDDRWRAATEGEAQLYLGRADEAMRAYRRAVALRPSPRELNSMYSQATWVIDQLDGADAPVRHSALEELFLPERVEPSGRTPTPAH